MSKKKHRRIWLEQEISSDSAVTGVTGITPPLPMDGHQWTDYKDIEMLETDGVKDGARPADD